MLKIDQQTNKIGNCKNSSSILVCQHSQQTVAYYMHTELLLKSKHELLICFWL